MKSSALLLRFYKWWWQGVHKDNADPRFKNRGLCDSLYLFTREKDIPYEIKEALHYRMKLQFVAHGLDRVLPFNQGLGDFFFEADRKACHLNPKRLQWVQDRIKEGVEE